MNFENEFAGINLLLKSNLETRGVDSFVLALIKVEKQIRKIFTYLIYQHPNYSKKNIKDLRVVLANNRHMYFLNFIVGINKIYPSSIEKIFGNTYNDTLNKINQYIVERNKIFHGQVTNDGLSRPDLIERVKIMEYWCKTISENFQNEIDYDGFGRNSYQKAKRDIHLLNAIDFETLDKYETLLNTIARTKIK